MIGDSHQVESLRVRRRQRLYGNADGLVSGAHVVSYNGFFLVAYHLFDNFLRMTSLIESIVPECNRCKFSRQISTNVVKVLVFGLIHILVRLLV